MRSCSLRGSRAVTDGAGTIGSHLVDQLVEAGASEIIVVDNFVRGRRANLARVRRSVNRRR
jgi:UDP-glucose 4-epimerase